MVYIRTANAMTNTYMYCDFSFVPWPFLQAIIWQIAHFCQHFPFALSFSYSTTGQDCPVVSNCVQAIAMHAPTELETSMCPCIQSVCDKLAKTFAVGASSLEVNLHMRHFQRIRTVCLIPTLKWDLQLCLSSSATADTASKMVFEKWNHWIKNEQVCLYGVKRMRAVVMTFPFWKRLAWDALPRKPPRGSRHIHSAMNINWAQGVWAQYPLSSFLSLAQIHTHA